MYKKLLSNLPFNPSLIGQVSFYAKRLHREEKLRRTGVIMVVLAVFIQMFAIISPPEPTLAESDNDIIRGGFDTVDQAVLHCLNGSLDFYEILTYYGLGCDSIKNGTRTTIRSNAADYHSLGRTPVANPSPRNGKNWTIYQVNIPGADQTLWMKDMQYWDSGLYSNYEVLRVENKWNQVMWIMYDCGNIVTEGRFSPPLPPLPPPPPPPPAPEKVVVCSNLAMNLANEAVVSPDTEIEVKGQASGRNLAADDDVTMYYEMVDRQSGERIGLRQTARYIPFVNGVAEDSDSHIFKLDEAGSYSIRLAVTYRSGFSTKDAEGSNSGGCIKNITVEEAALDSKKSASNQTQNIDDANGTTAQAGDVIIYTLTVTNTGNVTVSDYVVSENISDVLEYADVIDLSGGIQDDKDVVSWPAEDISPSERLEKKITVKVKSPVPQTPVSASDPGSFDLVMSNVFFNDSVNIKLPGGIVKDTEQIVNTLPSTGPGANIAIAVSVTVVASYFFARTRLLGKEIELVREEYAGSGSY